MSKALVAYFIVDAIQELTGLGQPFQTKLKATKFFAFVQKPLCFALKRKQI